MLLIIDGSSMLSTSYYGNLPKSVLFEKDPLKKELHYKDILQTSDGRFTNGVFTMMKTLLKILNTVPNITHIAVVFDKSRNTFRREQYAEYKAQRTETPQPLKEQFCTMEELLEKIGIKIYYSDNFEADDYAGSLAEKFKTEIPIRLHTADHDYLQLVDDDCNVRVWLNLKSADKVDDIYNNHFIPVYGEELSKEVRSFIPDKCYEVTADTCYYLENVFPNQIPDKKGIAGDNSDNIPGIKGIADKTAIPLLNEYGSLEGMYDVIDSINSVSMENEYKAFFKEHLGISRNPIKLLREGKDMAILSKKLATIKRDIPIAEELNNLSVKNINIDILKNEINNLEMNSLFNEAGKILSGQK